ncbi:MAG: bifunctional UDP-N-acetylglucosamine diphosphorylase/glucosamine-1-phosphate N-acetyltransferase GlmU [Alphaproteobacteria bacterium]|nr:bifunctional UDP-N-acetylglucosamine diphosphorylase/glucosamine-1-phosphate N-acetyltransferase GlmU [Alphaproteobacteria bacterium]
MTKSALACVVLAAGRGTRMRSELPKVLHPVAGLPMLGHVLRSAACLGPERIVVVVGPAMDSVAKAAAPHATVVQKNRLGTADAVRAAEEKLKGFSGNILVLFGDTPLLTEDALRLMLDARSTRQATVVVAAFTPPDSTGYGRVVLDATGQVTAIVEELDATPEQRDLTLCNGGMMLLTAPEAWALLAQIQNKNAKSEYYLTDIVALAHKAGLKTAAATVAPDVVHGVNDRVDLAAVEALMQQRLRLAAMRNGATLEDPASVTFSYDTVLATDVTVGPHVVFGPGVVVEERVRIRPFSHLEGAQVSAGAIIGPYARLRPGSKVQAGAHIGNFVELKNAVIGAGTKINHLTYIGDAVVGSGSNIGAGTITCNYDGLRKHQTKIGDNAFIGSNTALVAPVEIGSGAFVGAGSVITNNVPPNTLAVARGRQVNLENWAQRTRDGKKE